MCRPHHIKDHVGILLSIFKYVILGVAVDINFGRRVALDVLFYNVGKAFKLVNASLVDVDAVPELQHGNEEVERLGAQTRTNRAHLDSRA